MRILLVTSEVTFVKDNYNGFLESFFKHYPYNNEIVGLVVLKNNNPTMIIKGLGLVALGAKKTGSQLIKNSVISKSKDHQKIATKYNIATYYFKSVNEQNFHQFVEDHKIDLIINARTRDIYKKKILKLPTIGCINIHHGLLPEYRGLMCDLYALHEKREAGFTIHKMETKIDQGGIINRVPVTTPHSENNHNFPEHIYQSSIVEGKELSKTVQEIRSSKTIVTIPNSSDKIVYTKNPTKEIINKMIKKGMIL